MGEQAVHRLAQGALVLFVVLGATFSRLPPLLAVTLAVLAVLGILWLPGSGRAVLWGTLAVGAAVTALCSGSSSNVGWFGVCLLAGWCALKAGTRPAAVFLLIAAVVLLTQAVLYRDPGWLPWIAGTVFGTVVCVLARRQLELLQELRAAQSRLTEQARTEERLRIARELHDVVAHSITVSLLAVEGARLAVQDDPTRAGAALLQAEEQGRASLTEVRRAVGLLRTDGGPCAPLPGAGRLPELVEGFRRAGAPVAYEVVGDPLGLPSTTGLTVYRILQESLTNAVRHGGGCGTWVRLEVGERAELTVDSPGPPGPPSSGAGLPSMRERAAAMGGELSAGPHGDGWRVHAVLPA